MRWLRKKRILLLLYFYLNIDPRPQEMAHFLQDLFLQSIPGHSALHVQYERESKPKKRKEKQPIIVGFSTKNIQNHNLAKLAKSEYFYWHTSFLGGHYTLCYTPEG